MKNKMKFAAAAALFAAAPLWASAPATLSGIDGTALVNQGEEFVTATEAQALQPGDQVMVMEGGSARISFADGCVLPVAGGSMVVVPAVSTCAGGVASTSRVGAQYAQAVGDADDTSNLTQALVIGGTILAIGVILNQDDEPDPVPVSP